MDVFGILLINLIVLGIGLIVLYYLIRAAVRDAIDSSAIRLKVEDIRGHLIHPVTGSGTDGSSPTA